MKGEARKDRKKNQHNTALFKEQYLKAIKILLQNNNTNDDDDDYSKTWKLSLALMFYNNKFEKKRGKNIFLLVREKPQSSLSNVTTNLTVHSSFG
jgi:hypothetical protein